MRDYASVSPQFWIGETGKQLRGHPEAQVLALYLMTGPHSNMIGVFHCPILYMAHETGLGFEGASKGLARLIEVGFCEFDEVSETVFVVKMAMYQVGDQLKPDDNKVKGINKAYQNIAVDRMKSRFYEIYNVSYYLPLDPKNSKKQKPLRSPLKDPSKQLTRTGTRTRTETEILFETFWEGYPKKVGKDAALKQFRNREVDGELLALMVSALTIQKHSPSWKKDGGQFIPNPATWLSQGRWQDEVSATNDDPFDLRQAV